MKRRRLRWESWGVLDAAERRDRGRQCEPREGWRVRVWIDIAVWNWEARRFGRHALHVSGEARSERLARLIAIAAVEAIARK